MTSEQAAAVADAERLVCELREVGARLLADLPEGDDGQVRAELLSVFSRIRSAEIVLRNANGSPVEPAVDRFLRSVCILEPGAITTVKAAHAAYMTWANANGEVALTPMALTCALKARGISTSRTKATRLYVGVRVTALP